MMSLFGNRQDATRQELRELLGKVASIESSNRWVSWCTGRVDFPSDDEISDMRPQRLTRSLSYWSGVLSDRQEDLDKQTAYAAAQLSSVEHNLEQQRQAILREAEDDPARLALRWGERTRWYDKLCNQYYEFMGILGLPPVPPTIFDEAFRRSLISPSSREDAFRMLVQESLPGGASSETELVGYVQDRALIVTSDLMNPALEGFALLSAEKRIYLLPALLALDFSCTDLVHVGMASDATLETAVTLYGSGSYVHLMSAFQAALALES